MMRVDEFKEWVNTLDETSFVAVDAGGLTVMEIDQDGNQTGAYCEIGGDPSEEEE